MSALIALALLSASAQPPVVQGDIVVTGQRLQDSKAALQACLARNCPPDEDINATLAHAENQVAAGDYAAARRTLNASVGRNRDEAKSYPEPVSDLYRADALVANHLGLEEEYFLSTHAIVGALKAGIKEPDHRHFRARMEVASMLKRMRGFERAIDEYESIAKEADRNDRPDIAWLARLRGASLSYDQAPGPSSLKRMRQIAALTDPRASEAASLAKLYLAKIAFKRGKREEGEALIQSTVGNGVRNAMLIYAPPYELTVQEFGNNVDASTAVGNARRFAGKMDGQWIDVGFRVQPDGKVADVQVLKSGGSTDWAKPLLKSIEGRIYAPIRGDGAYQVERYAYTSRLELQAGSHIKRRSPRARVEQLDLSMRKGPNDIKERAAP